MPNRPSDIQANKNQFGAWFNSHIKDPFVQKIQKPIEKKVNYLFEKEFDKDISDAADIFGDFVNLINRVVRVIPKKKEDAPVLNSASVLPDKIEKVAKKIIGGIRKVFLSEKFRKVLVYTGVALSVTTILFTINTLYEKIVGAVGAAKDKDKESFADNMLDIAHQTGRLITNVSSLVVNLASEGLIVLSTMSWVPIVSAVALVFQTAAIVKHGSNLVRGIKKYHQFKVLVSGKNVDESFKMAQDYISSMEKRHVKKYFGKDQDWILNILKDVNDPENKKQAVKLLKGKIKDFSIHSGIGVGTEIISMVANVTMFIPATAVASPFLFIASAVGSLSKDVFACYSRRSFREGMENLVSNLNEEHQKITDKEKSLFDSVDLGIRSSWEGVFFPRPQEAT